MEKVSWLFLKKNYHVISRKYMVASMHIGSCGLIGYICCNKPLSDKSGKRPFILHHKWIQFSKVQKLYCLQLSLWRTPTITYHAILILLHLTIKWELLLCNKNVLLCMGLKTVKSAANLPHNGKRMPLHYHGPKTVQLHASWCWTLHM